MKTLRRKITFALIGAFLLASSAFAENCLLGPCKKADLPTCGSKLKGAQFSVTNCVTAISCATTASPGFTNIMVCDYTGSAWAYRVANATAAAVDLTAYAELSSATSTAFAPATNFTVATTAGNVTLTAGGTTQDGSIISTDDIFLTPDDALVAVAGGATTITSTAGTVAIASSAGSVTVTATGATQDVTLTATDDVILAATDDTTIAGDNFLVTNTTLSLNAAGGAIEVAVAAASTTVIGAFQLTASTAPPVACSAGTKGTMYFDGDIGKTCICNATNYVLMNDDTTTTGCS